MGALLYKVEAAVRLGYTASACTDEPCYWNGCFTKQVQSSKLCTIKFYTDKAKDKVKKTHSRHKRQPPVSTPVQQAAFLQSLAASYPSAVGLSTFKDYASSFVSSEPATVTMKLPPSLRSLYRPTQDMSMMSEGDIAQRCGHVKDSVTLTTTERKYVEEVTKTQADSSTWHELRAGRITSSVAHAAFHTKNDKPEPSLIKKICVPSATQINTIPVMYGRRHEGDAFDLYVVVTTGHGEIDGVAPSGNVYVMTDVPHQACSVTKCGHHLSTEKPYLGASPDGLVDCTCCGKGVLEIKCPHSMKDKKLKDRFGEKGFYIKSDMSLHEDSAYYTQVQHEMLLCNVQYCDLVVWTPIECLITRVPRDQVRIDAMLVKFNHLWLTAILPELVSRRLEYGGPKENIPQKQDKPRFCICQSTEEDDDMVACDMCNEWFHLRCLKLKRMPRTRRWYCTKCKAKKQKEE